VNIKVTKEPFFIRNPLFTNPKSTFHMTFSPFPYPIIAFLGSLIGFLQPIPAFHKNIPHFFNQCMHFFRNIPHFRPIIRHFFDLSSHFFSLSLHFSVLSSHFFRPSSHFLSLSSHFSRKDPIAIAHPSHSGPFAARTMPPTNQRPQKSLPALPTPYILKVFIYIESS
jgi:hypothetical protein